MTKKDKADGEKKKFGEKAAAQAEEEKDGNNSLFGGDTKSSTLNEISQPNFNSAKALKIFL